MGEGEVPLEAAGAFVHRLQVGEHRGVHVVLCDDRSRGDFAGGRPGLDPLLQHRDLGRTRSRLFVGRRHGAFIDAAEQPAALQVVGHDLLAGDELAEVGDVVHRPLDAAVLPVAAGAVRLEDGLRLLGEFGVVGRAGGRGEREEGERGEEGKAHVVFRGVRVGANRHLSDVSDVPGDCHTASVTRG